MTVILLSFAWRVGFHVNAVADALNVDVPLAYRMRFQGWAV